MENAVGGLDRLKAEYCSCNIWEKQIGSNIWADMFLKFSCPGRELDWNLSVWGTCGVDEMSGFPIECRALQNGSAMQFRHMAMEMEDVRRLAMFEYRCLRIIILEYGAQTFFVDQRRGI